MVAALPFVFARDQQVAIDESRILFGPDVTLKGLCEARRRLALTGPDEGNGSCAPEWTELSSGEFEAALSRIYSRDSGGEDETDDVSFDLEEHAGRGGPRDLLEDTIEAPVIRLVNQLLRRAVNSNASDLHIEPHEEGLRARLRVDGMLKTTLDRADVPVRRVVSRLKVMAGLDIAETRLPQDGHIALRLGGRSIDVRVSTLPGNYGERVVLRVLDRSSGLMPLEALGLAQSQIATLERLSARPNGVLLATGPTGSGKTTTLYSLLHLANSEERNIVTVEDPIEYDLPGVSQSQINNDIGMTFASGLRATLRQDPDVILVGEIRDNETAAVAAQAALTGHLVFSSLHANGSVATIVRLRDLQVDDFLIAATLRGVVAQRLLRRLCPECRRPRASGAADADLFQRAGVVTPERLCEPVGCEQCAQTGYRGRIGVFEIVEIDEAISAAIGEGAGEQRLRELSLAPENTLLGQGLARVRDGETSLAEAVRVVGDTL